MRRSSISSADGYVVRREYQNGKTRGGGVGHGGKGAHYAIIDTQKAMEFARRTVVLAAAWEDRGGLVALGRMGKMHHRIGRWYMGHRSRFVSGFSRDEMMVCFFVASVLNF